ncbi:MAG TPA: antibiotic biosynthesis monooxygenase [Prolixibacteraceae bacterium]|nr:antibiotic biosynthesis monooxygenase [Prolixibacteraceae bacterium]HPS12267.1 antibiotic biosynthesis monooxygenase [Prolixibacteraceae bacterium]
MAITTCVYVWIVPERIEAFIEASVENHNHSIQEPGNLRFDFCQDPGDPCKFMLYEAYVDEQSAAAHKETAHYQKWNETITPFMAKPRERTRYNLLSY